MFAVLGRIQRIGRTSNLSGEPTGLIWLVRQLTSRFVQQWQFAIRKTMVSVVELASPMQ
jgi:hypothetical protein